MGKTSSQSNLPCNPSLSISLNHLRSFVTLEEAESESWQPLTGLQTLNLSSAGQVKFLNHFLRLKQIWNVPGHYTVRSANNFPSDCGLASSASSFAALTLATWDLAERTTKAKGLSREELSKISRMGSGSSCRSLFPQWSVWRGEGAESLPLDLHLEHAVVIVADGKKAVSSSEAHSRVTTSLLFQGRPERAEARMSALIGALKSNEWRVAFELCWAEFWDMHALFETSQPGFGYMTERTMAILNLLRDVWAEGGDGPLVTMDAGANVHLLMRPDQTARADKWLVGWNTMKSWS